ncbi:MAG: phosphate/phosphite/phosphonate ABC transporter substrate-binding protein [Anaerolineales bacterium]|nr:phosphate/phosphite/phosphonate ABC transporter substrate-binding protein [Anaerolineales bacterium]MCB9127795.1 phosphate/phosphite/phosphonate ABC transporter substrate-binding protein [Ardenticatenales bacterium]
MTRKFIMLLAVLMLVLSIAACGNQSATTTDETDSAASEETMTDEGSEAESDSTDEAMTDEAMTDEEPMTDTIVMSFVPSGDSQEIVASGDEIAKLLSDATGMTIEANVATSYAAVVEAMCAGQAQVGWLNTFSYILAHERDCADIALATIRFGEPFYTGQIIANVDSGITSLEDITAETKVCWVDELSTSGYIIPEIAMKAAGIDTEALDAQFLGSHDNVANGVYNGDCEVGATFVDARGNIEDEHPDVMEKVIVIETSPEIPNDTVSFASSLPEETRATLTKALLDMAGTEEGAAALAAVYEIDGLVEKDDSFYDAFRTQLDAAGVNVEDFQEE